MAARLIFLVPTNRILSYYTKAWCDFHKINGHDTNNFHTLATQLAKLAQDGFLNEYLQQSQRVQRGATQDSPVEEQHERPIIGDLNVIVEGFAGGGVTGG